MKGALKRVSVFSNQSTSLVKLDLKDNLLHLSAQDDIKIEKSSNVKAVVSTSTPKKVEVPKAKAKLVKKEDVGQLSLFRI